MFKVIKGQLLEVMGASLARSSWKETIGATDVAQIVDLNTQEMLTIFELKNLDAWNAQFKDCMAVSDLADMDAVNALIETHNYDVYTKENEGLMNANITQLMSAYPPLDLNQLSPEATDQEELAFLYAAGVSGITKRRKYKLL